MKCEKCGAEIPEGAVVCPKCGTGSESTEKTTDEKIDMSNKIDNKIDKAAQASPNPQESKKSSEASEAADSEFDKQYSMTFEKKTEENAYKIDEELKRKREQRYDESFSNMSDAEKLKALEAARLKRKEKRERKQKKKEEGGVFAFLKRDKEDKPASESAVSSSESAAAAKQSADSLSASPFSGSRTQKLPKLDAEQGGTSDGEKAADEKSSDKRRSREKKSHKLPPQVGIAAGIAVAVLVIGIIIASVSAANRAQSDLPESPTVYAKDNTMYAAYDGKEIRLSDSFIKNEYKAPDPTPTASASDDEDEDEATASPEAYYEPVKEKELITYTEDGTGIYYFDNADLNTNGGSLNYAVSGKKKSTVRIADYAYYNIVVSDDGTGVLYLTGTDKYGGGGKLNYWSSVSKTSAELADGILPGDYCFGQGGSILYLDEYNSEYYVGDLHHVTITDGTVASDEKTDSDVYMGFGTNTSGTTVVYAKNYNDEDETFDLYMKNGGDDSVLITDGSRCAPIFLTTTDAMYAGGTYENYYQTLYYVSLTDGRKEKIGGDLTELDQISSDEQSVIYKKANAEGTAFDYFYASASGTEGQMLAQNITILDDEDHKRVSQFEISDDFTSVAFIQGYDRAVESGALYTVRISNGIVGSDKKISDTAYSCDITPDGQTIRYADNYDITWNLVKLNSYTNEKTTLLAEDVGAGAFTFDHSGEYIVYAKNYSLETKTGDVYCVSNKGKSREIVTGVSSYGLKSDGDIIYYNSSDGGSFELFKTAENGKHKKTIDSEVTKVIAY